MKTINREIKNKDGSIDRVIISSNDNYSVNLSKNYKLVGYAGNKRKDSFKNSILGYDIGLSNSGFVSMTVIASIIAILAFVSMYFIFRI